MSSDWQMVWNFPEGGSFFQFIQEVECKFPCFPQPLFSLLLVYTFFSGSQVPKQEWTLSPTKSCGGNCVYVRVPSGRISKFTLHKLMSQCQCSVCGRKAELSPDVHWGETNQHHCWPWPLPLNFDLERRLMGEGGGAVRWLGCAGPRTQNAKFLEIWVTESERLYPTMYLIRS